MADAPATAVPVKVIIKSLSAQPVEKSYKISITIPFDSAEIAFIVKSSVAVDPELHPEQVSRDLRVEGSTISVDFAATEMRMLRSAVSAFFDLVTLATQTVERFGGSINKAALVE